MPDVGELGAIVAVIGSVVAIALSIYKSKPEKLHINADASLASAQAVTQYASENVRLKSENTELEKIIKSQQLQMQNIVEQIEKLEDELNESKNECNRKIAEMGEIVTRLEKQVESMGEVPVTRKKPRLNPSQTDELGE